MLLLTPKPEQNFVCCGSSRTQRDTHRLAKIGRRLPGMTKHDIKRVDRFLGNHRILISDAM